jgi:hypothetical protein
MTLLLLFFLTTKVSFAEENLPTQLPLNCSELMPEPTPYLNFFEACGNKLATNATDRKYAVQIYKVLYLRKRILPETKDANPIDTLIQKTLCFYREQKEPLKAIAIDNPAFINYLKGSLPELERKVNEVVYQIESERLRKEAYEKSLQKNSVVIEKVQDQAYSAANQTFDKISKKAKQKIK